VTPLVFLHGVGGGHAAWDRQVVHFRRLGYECVAWDQPGYGGTALVEPYSLEKVTDALRKLLPGKSVLVGHSMGTPVALTFLRRHPRNVSGLVIVDGFIPSPPKDDSERRKRAEQRTQMIKMYRSPDYMSAMNGMFQFMFTGQTPAALRDEIRKKMSSAPQYVLASAMEEMMAMEPPANVQFDIPALVLMVKRDSQAAYEAYLRTLFPKLRSYQAWEGAGHFLMMEQPERFNGALAGFLDGK